MDFYDKITVLKSSNKLTNKDIGAVVGKSGEAFRMAMNRKSLSDLEKEKLNSHFDIEQISEHQVKEQATEYVKDLFLKRKGIPYYDIDFTASFVGVENSQKINPDSYVTHPFFVGCDYIVRASGQSMAKIIKHGDAIGLIKIENWHEFIPLGEVYAIVTKNNFRMVKVITKGKDDDHYTLISKPSEGKKDEFPPQQIKKDMILSIFKVQASSHLL